MTDDFSLATDAVHLTDDLGAHRYLLPTEAVPRTLSDITSGRLVSVFSYASTWDTEERHPTGDELVYVVAGDVDLLTDAGDGERAHRLPCGRAFVVPAGSWHRVAVREAATLLFVTPVPARTEHRAVTKDS